MKSVLTGAAIASPFLLAGGVIMKSLSSWMEEETTIARMGNVFDAVGLKASELAPKIEALATALMKTTTMTDEQVRGMATQAAQMGVSAENIEAFIKAAVGAGAQTGRDPEGVMRTLVRASQGYTRQLTLLFPQIDKTASTQEQFRQGMALAAKGMGIAFKETTTLSGGFKQLRNAFGEIFDTLGKGLFEKSGLNAEIKKVTASIFGIIATIEKGFGFKKLKMFEVNPMAGIFKGFDFKGLGDWISDLIMRFTAMIMTLPTVFRALKDIFGSPDKMLNFLGTVMTEVASILITGIIKGFAALKDIFVALGQVLVSVFLEGLQGLDVPWLTEKINKVAGTDFQKTLLAMSPQDQIKLAMEKYLGGHGYETGFKSYGGEGKGVGKNNPISRPEFWDVQSKEYEQWWSTYFKEQKEFKDVWVQMSGQTEVGMETMFAWFPEMGERLRQGLFDKGVKGAIASVEGYVANMNSAVKSSLGKINTEMTTMTGEDIQGTFFATLTALRKKTAEETADMIPSPDLTGMGGSDMGDSGKKASFSIVSMADQWKKMQEGITKDKDAKDTSKNTAKTATNTEKTVEYVTKSAQALEIIANVFKGGSYSLFS